MRKVLDLSIRWISLKLAIAYGLTLFLLALYTAGLQSYAVFLKDRLSINLDSGEIPSGTNLLTGPFEYMFGMLPSTVKARFTAFDSFLKSYALDAPILQFLAFGMVFAVLQGRHYLRARRDRKKLEEIGKVLSK